MEQDIRALLLAASGVTDICGTRINFGANPQGAALPAIVLNTVSDVQGVVLTAPEGHAEARVQVDCYASTYGAAKTLANAVRSRLTGYAGGDIQGVFQASSRDYRDGNTTDPDRPYRVSADYTIIYYLS